MSSKYYENLIKTVLEHSTSQNWVDAVNEWYIDDIEEDETLSESCICGHPNLRYLFTIKNETNNNTLFPIGSECIKKFERDELYQEATIKEKLFELYHIVENNSFIEFNSKLFSRKLLKYLYDAGAFKANEYNHYNPLQDYNFMLKTFNQKNPATSQQDKKVKAIILNSIKPFIQEQLKNKIKHKN